MIYDFLKKCNFNENSIIFEIGAHMGYGTENIYSLSNKSKIFSFEPDPRNIKILKERKIDKICSLFEIAVSDVDGESDFYLSSGKVDGYCDNTELLDKEWSASSSLLEPKECLNLVKWCSFNDKIKVKTKKIDSITRELNINKLNLIYIDAQGAEHLVLNGSKETLLKTEYLIIKYSEVEYYSNQQNSSNLVNILGNDWIVRYKDDINIILENRKLRDSYISNTGYWTTPDLNDHVTDNNLLNSIKKYIVQNNINNCLDIGCGNGFYTNEISKIIKCVGIDGNPNTKTSENIFIKDITKNMNYGKFDLVLCLEVGEHIDSKYENKIINNIIKHVKDTLIISWAIPDQGGYGHVNCRTNEYIKEKIISFGFTNFIELENELRGATSCDWFKNTIMAFKVK